MVYEIFFLWKIKKLQVALLLFHILIILRPINACCTEMYVWKIILIEHIDKSDRTLGTCKQQKEKKPKKGGKQKETEITKQKNEI